MAKEIYWYGDGDSDQGANLGKWDYNINWRLCSDGSPSTIPVTTDIVHIDSRAYYNSALGRHQDITAGIEAAGTGEPDLEALYISFDGNIGSSSLWLAVEVSNSADSVFVFTGTGVVYMQVSHNGAADSFVDLLVLNSASGSLYMKGEQNDAAIKSELTKIIAVAGVLNLATIADADTISPKEIIAVGDSAVINIGTGCMNIKAAPDEFTDFVIAAGVITSDSPINNCIGYSGGTFNWGTSTSVAKANVDLIGLLTLYGTFVFNWMAHHSSPPSVLYQFLARGGTLDASQAINADVKKQLGSGAGELSEMWPGSTVLLNNGVGVSVGFGAGSKIKYYGGTLMPAYNEEMTW